MGPAPFTCRAHGTVEADAAGVAAELTSAATVSDGAGPTDDAADRALTAATGGSLGDSVAGGLLDAAMAGAGAGAGAAAWVAEADVATVSDAGGVAVDSVECLLLALEVSTLGVTVVDSPATLPAVTVSVVTVSVVTVSVATVPVVTVPVVTAPLVTVPVAAALVLVTPVLVASATSFALVTEPLMVAELFVSVSPDELDALELEVADDVCDVAPPVDDPPESEPELELELEEDED